MGVFGLAASVGHYFRIRYLADKADIDNAIFKLHYRFTTAAFFLSCVLVSAYDLIGPPIDCISDDFPRPVALNTYCWISSTFTLPYQTNKLAGVDNAHPGVGPVNPDNDDLVRHAYYQWVPFMLFFQGILFYMPHYFWKSREQDKMSIITDGMRSNDLDCQTEAKEKKKILLKYLEDTRGMHLGYAWSYVICEILNFVNVVGNIFFIDKFLGGAFLKFGARVIQFTEWEDENRTDPLIEIFPRVTKCTFHSYGSSGTIQKHDAMCILALNVLNEKLYVFLWFWLVILSVLSGLALAYRLALLVSSRIRGYIFQYNGKVTSPAVLDRLVHRTSFGDFFFIHMLSKNLEGLVLKEVMDDLANELTMEKLAGRRTPPSPKTDGIPMLPRYSKPVQLL
ncbi:innexin inx3-like [Artemia franciscana]|uniref:Innexin n=1 Tax=Artemia franciscana TaxID=6661 RepID=A0AA88IES3_ARTSF|nr:hypothetical protein QYM36_003223 [Artemia franciscana]KAK2722957.1 hypothetical protein QYM36_003223 [Artemia franciscana]